MKTILPINLVLGNYEINYDGEIYQNGEIITLEQFNLSTNLNVNNNLLLAKIVFSGLKLPPIYWKDLELIYLIENHRSIENVIIVPIKPIEAIDYLGFYIIPYYSNYLISKDGVLLKKSNGSLITASLAATEYYTFRMTHDNGSTDNRLRHRILGLTFKKYWTDPDDLTINHIDGIRGHDALNNLEWLTLEDNIKHAIDNELYGHVKEIEVRNIHTNQVYIYPSQASVARELNISTTTLGRYVDSNGGKQLNGFQFRRFPCQDPWPDIISDGNFEVTKPCGQVIRCSSIEAANLCNVTRTSLMRILREGRNGANGFIVRRI